MMNSMEHNQHEEKPEKKESAWTLSTSILVSSIILAGAWIYTAGLNAEKVNPQANNQNNQTALNALEEKIIPSAGVKLPVKWDDLGKKLIESGVIDSQKLDQIYAGRGGMSAEMKALLQNTDNGQLTMNRQNSGELLNLLWAFGLANKNTILEKGPMMDPKYGGAGNFASTGGWTVAKGGAMQYYSKFRFVTLTAQQQALVENVSKNIYRPCCGNSVYFPDCNHGMAMLGLLELMAAQGVGEDQMYKVALAVNSYWFPDTYLTIARYFQSKGISWDATPPKSILGYNFSSAQGYAQIRSQVAPQPSTQQQGGCGVDSGAPAQAQPQPQQQSGLPVRGTQTGCGV